ncbi:hypothetical protein TNIN_298841 [Trichonephila inaurata madagascariensis]|uniref:Uncharacterized protein n=1 Tax=Trichonephila inaurata madagascariensis TaxID=2747483 RepID=A0A8X6X9B6_9ARAC|nr:hypothetical protein TNIN_298841 [Trichonephila inaurata madagascariensis]
MSPIIVGYRGGGGPSKTQTISSWKFDPVEEESVGSSGWRPVLNASLVILMKNIPHASGYNIRNRAWLSLQGLDAA